MWGVGVWGGGGGGVNASGFLHSSMEYVAKQMFDDKFVYVNTVCLGCFSFSDYEMYAPRARL